MMTHASLRCLTIGLMTVCVQYICVLAMAQTVSHEATAGSGQADWFREKIEPVLQQACYSCHSAAAENLEAALALDSPSGLRRGGDSGPAIDLENPRESLLLQAVRHEGGLAMPPDAPQLPPQVIADFERWLVEGAVDPRPDKSVDSNGLNERAKSHWAFQPLKRHNGRLNAIDSPPKVQPSSRIGSQIDAFLLDRLAQQNWSYAEEAEKGEWLRRISLDVTGLPPTLEELQAFVADDRPDAHQRVVDRLLASPKYGQKLAQGWLDVVRYAESEGYEYDRHLPDAWRYRDYVVDAFNADKPFNHFVIEQIAGDELESPRQEQLTAAVFHRLGPVRRNAGNPDIALSRNEVLTERTDILGTAFLGLTVGCARCHNHKLEPITQKDYYQLQAYLAATAEHNVSLAPEEQQAKWDATTARLKDQIKQLQQQAKLAEAAEKERLSQRIEQLDRQLPEPLATIPTIRNDPQERTPIHVLRRGVWENKGPQVSPRPLSLLASLDRGPLAPETPNPRFYLAEWIVADNNPLTVRVIANRIWQQHFGAGLIRTANDFGLNGDRPSHPELLDWLAALLLERQWDLKSVHRAILSSGAYRQSQATGQSEEVQRLDPENRWLSHFPRRRLSSEEVRDAMLLVAGQLNTQVGGPSVMLPVDPEMVQLLYKPSQWVVTKDEAMHARRSIYLFAKRNLRLTMMENLDAPTLLCSCGRRESSTHAPQALELMNGWQANRLAESFAQRLERESQGNRRRLIELAFLHTLGQLPNEQQRILSAQFLATQTVTEFALAMFNLNEFIYVR